MEQPKIMFTSDKALSKLVQLGYDDISKAPTGRGNDYLTALVRIAGGGISGC